MGIKGIQFLFNDDGERSSVLIDLKQHGDLWEDFYDQLLVEERKDEPRETLEEVKRQLGLVSD